MIVAPAFKTFRFAALAVILSSPVVAAAPAPQDIVNARVAGFKKMGGAMKAIGDQLKSGALDKAKTIAAAQIIAATAKGQGRLFPAGTGPAAGIKTDALPAIWTNRAAFDADMAKLIGESGKLVTVAGTGDAAAIGAQMKAVGGACSACHRQFRADN
jgi:cytochrome c556